MATIIVGENQRQKPEYSKPSHIKPQLNTIIHSTTKTTISQPKHLTPTPSPSHTVHNTTLELIPLSELIAMVKPNPKLEPRNIPKKPVDNPITNHTVHPNATHEPLYGAKTQVKPVQKNAKNVQQDIPRPHIDVKSKSALKTWKRQVKIEREENTESIIIGTKRQSGEPTSEPLANERNVRKACTNSKKPLIPTVEAAAQPRRPQ